MRREYRVLKLHNNKVSKITEHETTGAEKAKLFPTDLGLVVTDFLKQYFDDIMDYGFTARIEEEFDEVAQGKMKWNKMLLDFYEPFKKDVNNTIETAERIKGERELGKDPETGKPVVARMGRYGPMVQIGTTDDEEKPRFAKLQAGQSIETITFEEALDLFKIQGALGEHEGKEVSVGVGRFGPYVKWGDDFISVPRGTEITTVDLAKAIGFIEAKKIADAPVGTYEGKPVTKGTGRFGPFIKWDGIFINVPRRYNFEKLTQAEMNELIEAKMEKESNRYIQRWEQEKISVENARWGPIIKFGKKIVKLPRKADNTKYTAEDLQSIPLEEVKQFIEAEIPGAFAKKEKQPKAAPKKTAAKKSAVKKKK